MSLWRSTASTNVTRRERVSPPKSSASGSEIGPMFAVTVRGCVHLGGLAKRHESPSRHRMVMYITDKFS